MTSQNRSNRHAMRTSYGAHRMATHTIATLTLPQPPSVMTCICRQSPTLCPVVYNGTEIQLRCRRCRAITLAKQHGKKVSNHHAHSLGCPRGVPTTRKLERVLQVRSNPTILQLLFSIKILHTYGCNSTRYDSYYAKYS